MELEIDLKDIIRMNDFLNEFKKSDLELRDNL